MDELTIAAMKYRQEEIIDMLDNEAISTALANELIEELAGIIVWLNDNDPDEKLGAFMDGAAFDRAEIKIKTQEK